MFTGEMKKRTFENAFLRVEVKVPLDEYNYQQQTVTWYRLHFHQLLSNFAGLAISILKSVKFAMNFLQNHQQNKSMLSSLYGDDGGTDDHGSSQDGKKQGDEQQAAKTFEKRVKNRIDFSNSFCFYQFFRLIKSVCCCFKDRCNRVEWIRKGSLKHRKFQLALERLSKERDIQYIIEMNRISRLLHRLKFLSRQRRAIKYSDRYVISVKDTRHLDTERPDPQDQKDKDDQDKAKVLEGFDPQNNYHDRLMLYEVIGVRLRTNEFQDLSSSETENDDSSQAL